MTTSSRLALLTLLCATGCGSASQLASNNGQANAGPSDTSVTGGGSLALTEPSTTTSGVSQIVVAVVNEPACGAQVQRGPGHERGERPLPPEHGRDDRGGHGDRDRPPMPPPPPPMGQGAQPGFGGQGGASLADTSTSTATDGTAVAAVAAANGAASTASQCIVKQVSQAYEAGAAIQLDGIPDGTYTLVVLLADANAKDLEQGSAPVTITAGQVASAAITLEPMPVGSVAVTVAEATPSKLAFTQASLSAAAGACQALTVQSLDANGLPASLAAALTVDLTSSSSTGAFYSDGACATAVTSAAVAASSSSVTVYYKDATAGSATLTVADPATSGLGSATTVLTVTAQ